MQGKVQGLIDGIFIAITELKLKMDDPDKFKDDFGDRMKRAYEACLERQTSCCDCFRGSERNPSTVVP